MDRFALRALTIALALFIAGAFMLATRGAAPHPGPTVIHPPTTTTAPAPTTSTSAPATTPVAHVATDI